MTRWPMTADCMYPNLSCTMRLQARVSGLFDLLLFAVGLCSELFETEVLLRKLVPILLVPTSHKNNLRYNLIGTLFPCFFTVWHA